MTPPASPRAQVVGREEILVRAPNWVGDVVMSTPGLRALRAARPDARISVQARAPHLELLAGSPDVDALLPLESYHRGARAMLAEARRMRSATRYDLGICIPDSYSSALLMRMAGVARVCGFEGRGRGALLHTAVVRPAQWRSGGAGRDLVARERFVLALLEAIGCPPQGEALRLVVTPEERAALAAVLIASDLAADTRPWVGLAPGAGYGPAKLWPAESFAAVGDALAEAGARVILIGAPAERGVAGAVAAAMRGPCVDLVGRLGLGASKALVSRLALLICNDAGARHIAAAFGVPSLVFFGPTSVAKTDCNLEHVSVFERDEPCRPCYRRTCPIEHPCLRGIAPSQVIPRAVALLADSASRSRELQPALP